MDLRVCPSFNFKINNEDWKIIELTQKEIIEHKKDKQKYGYGEVIENEGRYYGSTYTDEQVIVLDKDLPLQRKRKTLIHELTHCFISTTITHLEMKYDEEFVADIVTNSFDVISKVINNYFNVK